MTPNAPTLPPPLAVLRRHAAIVLAVATIVCAPAASAGRPDNISPAEMALIPEYCADANTFGYGDAYSNTSPNAPKWVAMMGHGFWAIHHYCWALINLARVERAGTPPHQAQWIREAALSDLGYVLEHTPADFILLPEIYTKIGDVELQLNRPRQAREAFDKARQLKPNYWPAYYHWADYLRRQGDRRQARQVAEEGLAQSPGTKPLIALLDSLQGDGATERPRGSSAPAGAPTSNSQAPR